MIGKAKVCAVDNSIPLDIYIQGISGKLYTEDEWNDQETPNGVAVISDKCSFVVNRRNAEYSSGTWEPSSVLTGGEVLSQSDIENGNYGYDGQWNTKLMDTTTQGTMGYLAYNDISNIGVRGYVPSIGEMVLYVENFNKIESLMNLIV